MLFPRALTQVSNDKKRAIFSYLNFEINPCLDCMVFIKELSYFNLARLAFEKRSKTADLIFKRRPSYLKTNVLEVF